MAGGSPQLHQACQLSRDKNKLVPCTEDLPFLAVCIYGGGERSLAEVSSESL